MRQFSHFLPLLGIFALSSSSHIKTPPYFDLASISTIHSSVSCGSGIPYCPLVRYDEGVSACGICTDENNSPDVIIAPESDTVWRTPTFPNIIGKDVNLTIDFDQMFDVTYFNMRMGDSPRPEVWVLEGSNDFGQTFSPIRYFASSIGQCMKYFGPETTPKMCDTKFSKIVPLTDGEIYVRFSPDSYKLTNLRIVFITPKIFMAHLKDIDTPEIASRYYFSVARISIGGRCICKNCDVCVPNEAGKMTCGCDDKSLGDKAPKPLFNGDRKW